MSRVGLLLAEMIVLVVIVIVGANVWAMRDGSRADIRRQTGDFLGQIWPAK